MDDVTSEAFRAYCSDLVLLLRLILHSRHRIRRNIDCKDAIRDSGYQNYP